MRLEGCALLLLVAALAGCTPPKPAATGSNSPSPQPAAAPAAPYRKVLADLDAQLAGVARSLVKMPESRASLLAEQAALQRQRAQFTGDYADYVAAQKTLDEALPLAGSYQVPCGEQLRLHLAVHRIAQAAALLPNCKPPGFQGPDADWLGLKAEIAFQQGQTAAALAGYRSSLAVSETLPTLTRLATFHQRQGNLSEANALLQQVQLLSGEGSANYSGWLYVQRGMLALNRGRFDQARALYELAAQKVSGWWLVEEHIAEVLALQGEVAQAEARYRQLVKTAGHPEHYDALAKLLREGSKAAEAAPLIARAAALHAERMAQLPEAALGHTLDHALQFGSAAEALALAQRNVALRPNSEARIRLAQALHKAGQTAAAQVQISQLLAEGYDNAETHAIAAQLAAALGQSAVADAERDAALASNSAALRMYALVAPALPDLAQ